MLPDNAIAEFQKIYQKETGETVSLDSAKQKAENFIQLFALLTTKSSNINQTQNQEAQNE